MCGTLRLLVGLLATLPEYLISVALALPLLKQVGKTSDKEADRDKNPSEDMVGTMALAYQSRYKGCEGKIEGALMRLSAIMRSYRIREEKYQPTGRAISGISSAEEYEMVARLIKAAREVDREETAVDREMTPIVNGRMTENGLVGTARVFGKRKKHLILACDDPSGGKISSRALRAGIESTLGIQLGQPEYYRRDKMALMECTARQRLKVSVATAGVQGHKNEVSGDTVRHFKTEGDYHSTLLSDGMGSGEIARETSAFVCDFLGAALNIGSSEETLIHMLNHTLKSRREECSATVDLLEIDLIRGEGRFIKSGAAPSYIKRGSSIFRIKSQTAPLGLLSSIDAEKIKVDVKPGDYIIMLSDGVVDETDDAPWLLLLLGEPAKEGSSEYASLILEEAKRKSKTGDDMTVAVIRIDEA